MEKFLKNVWFSPISFLLIHAFIFSSIHCVLYLCRIYLFRIVVDLLYRNHTNLSEKKKSEPPFLLAAFGWIKSLEVFYITR